METEKYMILGSRSFKINKMQIFMNRKKEQEHKKEEEHET